jgi:hypothetical protein
LREFRQHGAASVVIMKLCQARSIISARATTNDGSFIDQQLRPQSVQHGHSQAASAIIRCRIFTVQDWAHLDHITAMSDHAWEGSLKTNLEMVTN